MANVMFVIIWTLRNGTKQQTQFTVPMHYEMADAFRNAMWDALAGAHCNPDSITYEILS